LEKGKNMRVMNNIHSRYSGLCAYLHCSNPQRSFIK
jgi:hypothetical protein